MEFRYFLAVVFLIKKVRVNRNTWNHGGRGWCVDDNYDVDPFFVFVDLVAAAAVESRRSRDHSQPDR